LVEWHLGYSRKYLNIGSVNVSMSKYEYEYEFFDWLGCQGQCCGKYQEEVEDCLDRLGWNGFQPVIVYWLRFHFMNAIRWKRAWWKKKSIWKETWVCVSWTKMCVKTNNFVNFELLL
jgi:hypothetical protein